MDKLDVKSNLNGQARNQIKWIGLMSNQAAMDKLEIKSDG